MILRLLLIIFSLGLLTSGFTSCEPTSYTVDAPDTLLQRRYCNDPQAVNFNWDSPGRPDNSICLYPTDFFTGTYLYTDSIYLPDGSFDSARSPVQYTMSMQALSREKFALFGFCGDSLRLTAGRYFSASLDTTILNGQPFCRSQDTVSGTITRRLEDSIRILISFRVVSDSGIAVHRGTAYRQ